MFKLENSDEKHKMIRDLTEIDTANRKEGHASDEKVAAAASTSTQLSRLKDVRIVRVSRGFGGKDRHSKVCTVKGLRDRRVRLSVPTAIQLYDLQDRLGLSQPSKVVDWLLNVAKHDIDKLPPLPMFPANFGLINSFGVSSDQNSNSPLNEIQLINFSKNIGLEGSSGLARQSTWSSNTHWRSVSQLHGETNVIEKEDWTSNRDGEGSKDRGEYHGASAHVSSSNLSQRGNHPPFLDLLNGIPLDYQYWEPSNLSLSQSRKHGFAYQGYDRRDSVDVASLPSPLSLSTGMPQFLVCSPGVAQSYIPAHVTSSMEIDPRNINLAVYAGQMMSTSSQPQLSYSLNSSLYPTNQPIKSITLGMPTDNPFHSTYNSDSQSHETRNFPSDIQL